MREGSAVMAPGSDSPMMANPQPLVLEVFSNSEKAWHVGIVMGAKDGMVTVRFIGAGGEKRQKAAFQQDPMFAQFGTYIGDKCPPGVVKVPSTTRPGQYSFFDQAAQRKFATLELVWHAYLEKRLIDEDMPNPNSNLQHQGMPAAPVATTMQSAAPQAPPTDKAPVSAPAPPTVASPAAASLPARCAPEGPLVIPKALGSSGAESMPASIDRDAYRPEGPVLSPPGSPRRGWVQSAWSNPSPGWAVGRFGPGSSSVSQFSLHDWAAQYVHQPVMTTAGINYLNQISIVFAAFNDLFFPLAAANAAHRERIIHAIDSGAFMFATVDVFDQLNAASSSKHLTWESGQISGFVTAVFTQYGLSAPIETQLHGLFQAFDIKKQMALGAQECVLLVDAVARSIFRISPAPGVAAEERPVMPDRPIPVIPILPEQAQLDQHQAMDFKNVESPCELHGLELMKALSAAVLAGHPFTALLDGSLRRNASSFEAGQAQQFVYSNLANKGKQTGPTEVHGVGLVDGATSIGRLLIQRLPTSVLSGSPQGQEVRLRLQAKVAAMQAAVAARQGST